MTCRTPGGVRLQLAFTRFLSRTRRHLAGMRLVITPLNCSAELQFLSRVDGQVQNLRHTHLHDVHGAHGAISAGHGLTCRTIGTDITIAMLAAERVTGGSRSTVREEDSALASTRRLQVTAAQQQSLCLTKLVIVTTSRDVDSAGDPLAGADALLADCLDVGFAALLAEHEEAWAHTWQEAALEIAERDTVALTQGLRYALYQMFQNAPQDDPTVNIGAKGLTGEHYYGTYFWDTELFMLPLFALTQPAVARNLLCFRARALPAAREKAREMGLAGAAFPWMSDADGHESCTLWQFSLLAIHVTGAVAWAAWFYYCVTDDLAFLAREGIDLLVETSRFWASRVHYREEDQRYVINRVLGPDEYHQGVHNNYYTNLLAQENLLKTDLALKQLHAREPAAYREALRRLEVSDKELAHFAVIARQLYLPYDAERQLHLQDDRFLALEPYDQQQTPLGGPLNQLWSYDRHHAHPTAAPGRPAGRPGGRG